MPNSETEKREPLKIVLVCDKCLENVDKVSGVDDSAMLLCDTCLPPSKPKRDTKREPRKVIVPAQENEDIVQYVSVDDIEQAYKRGDLDHDMAGAAARAFAIVPPPTVVRIHTGEKSGKVRIITE